MSIAFGRGVRYFGEGILAVMYGKQALDYIHDNSRTVGLVLGLLVLAGGVAYYLWKRRTADLKVGQTAVTPYNRTSYNGDFNEP